jgi:predicted O-linked N-acetylglucosamine transferase (SPINDLY family)
VLKSVDSSRIVLLAGPGSYQRRITDSFGVRGISEERLTFIPLGPRDRYLRAYHLIDIGLDTFPYNGHTTSIDAMWMGVPVVSLIGKTSVGRAGFSLLSNLNLAHLAVATPDEYIQTIRTLANDLPALSKLRHQLRDRMKSSPITDAKAYVRNVEAAYRLAWREWCDRADKESLGRPFTK